MKKMFLLLLLGNFLSSTHAQPDVSAQLDQFFKKAEAHGYSGNVMVAYKGQVLLRNGYGWQDGENQVKETAETIFDIGSLTKQFTGAAILKLQSQGKLSVQDKLTKYFSNVPDDKKDITLMQLLTHSAGFPGAIDDDYDLIGADDFMQLAFSTPLLFTPGTQYEYSNVGFSILGIITEKVSGKNYEQFLHDALFVPAGMLHTGYQLPKFDNKQVAVTYRDGERDGTMLEKPWAADGPGWNLKANGGILTTLDDMHNWYLALRNHTIFSAAEMKTYLSPYVKEYPDGGTYYSFGWVLEPRENGDTLIWHNGGNGAFNTFAGFDLKNDFFVEISSNSNDKIADDYAAVVQQIISGDYKPIDEKIVSAYTGNYKLESGDMIHCSFNELDQLVASFNSAGGLIALSGDGSEEKSKTDAYNARTQEMIENIFKNDFTALANAWDHPVQDVQQTAGQFWNDLKQRYGNEKKVQVIGSVARPRRGLYITFVQVDFEKAIRYFIYSWKGEHLDDMQSMMALDKIFDHQGADTFFAANNNLAIVFGEGSIFLTRGNNAAIKGVKVE